eukprot:4046672-Karenia_brevis.AAC.1
MMVPSTCPSNPVIGDSDLQGAYPHRCGPFRDLEVLLSLWCSEPDHRIGPTGSESVWISSRHPHRNH